MSHNNNDRFSISNDDPLFELHQGGDDTSALDDLQQQQNQQLQVSSGNITNNKSNKSSSPIISPSSSMTRSSELYRSFPNNNNHNNNIYNYSSSPTASRNNNNNTVASSVGGEQYTFRTRDSLNLSGSLSVSGSAMMMEQQQEQEQHVVSPSIVNAHNQHLPSTKSTSLFTSASRKFTINSTRSRPPMSQHVVLRVILMSSTTLSNTRENFAHRVFVERQQHAFEDAQHALEQSQVEAWSKKYSSAATFQSLSEECAALASSCTSQQQQQSSPTTATGEAERERPLLVYSLRALLHEAARLEISRLTDHSAIRRNVVNGWKTLTACLVEALNEGSDPQHILNTIAAFGVFYPDIPSPAYARRPGILTGIESSLRAGKDRLEDVEELIQTFDILHRRDSGRCENFLCPQMQMQQQPRHNNNNVSPAASWKFVPLQPLTTVAENENTITTRERCIAYLQRTFPVTSPKDPANRTFAALSREIRMFVTLKKLLRQQQIQQIQQQHQGSRRSSSSRR